MLSKRRTASLFSVIALSAVMLGCFAQQTTAQPREYVHPLGNHFSGFSASFGEFRPVHLHAGIDFSTGQVTGMPVHAITDGEVYRVKSSAGGYGNVVYLRHPNGFRSVYAHLESFSPKIAGALPAPAHRLGGTNSGMTMEVYPSHPVRVSKGEIIARSGESGSGSPHLHFELRDASDRPVNPVLHRVFSADDAIPPRISAVIVEPAAPGSTVNGSLWPVRLTSENSRLTASGLVRILIEGYDLDGKGAGRLSFTEVSMKANAQPWSRINMAEFSYGSNREVGLIYDFFRTGFSPTFYTLDLTGPEGAGEVIVKSRGRIVIDKKTEIAITAKDLAGNTTSFDFTLIPGASHREYAFEKNGFERHSQPAHISEAGAIINRAGEEFVGPEITTVKNEGLHYLATRARPKSRIQFPGGGSLHGVDGDVYLIQNGPFPLPEEAVSTSVLVGPFGRWTPDGVISLPNHDGRANGIARYSHGAWKWIGGEVSEELIITETLFLGPFVAVRDETPPRGKFTPTKYGPAIAFEDDFSGVNGSSIKVHDAMTGAPLSGRYDGDPGLFYLEGTGRPAAAVRVVAQDRAGNRWEDVLTP